ncbi:DNA replication/repair protein RecF [Marinimicrobium alkaliphilum]|uniref:DNA replication/repair protein RecF n=1 Tax=Marinimicrobium alkaliphilum TaxID=2202654 RepID=UPI000DB92501|nr:DNA replication/repair protein RecF [Marinimicrobium alkaliphilum]
MSLKRLAIHQLRNIESAELVPSPQVNLIYGKNGSGKTSILEAINILSLGRSFRSHRHKALIRQGQPGVTLFGRVSGEGTDLSIGVSRSLSGEAILKANGSPVGSVAELASYLPVQAINSDTFSLLEGSPKVRRQYIDWLVFHVEPQFFNTWKTAQKSLKQRNSLLRHDRIRPEQLTPWDRPLIEATEAIDTFRAGCIEQLKTVFNGLVHDFVAVDDLVLNYYRGWDRQQRYADVLAAGFDQDRKQGFTRQGAHRADLRITVGGLPAADVLSRGQQKCLVCALKIAQGYLFSQLTGRRCVYLVDDLPSELDGDHRAMLVEWLERMQTQVFITGVEKEALEADWLNKPETEVKVFHVEQGKVVPFEQGQPHQQVTE